MAAQNSTKKKTVSASRYFGEYLLMLLGPAIMAGYYCGERALLVMLVGILSACAADLAGGLLFYNKLTLKDLCAVYTGAAISLMMPSTVPLYIPAIACVFAILAVKIPFGGALRTPVVPAAAGFAFACVCFSQQIFTFPPSATSASGQFVSGVSLAAMLRNSSSMNIDLISAADILSGSVSGPMGTGCAIVLLGCAVFLIIRRKPCVMNILGFLVTCTVMAIIFPRVNTGILSSVVLELCSGSLLFAAVFLVTDPSNSAKSPLDRLGYGIYCGILCMITRYFGVYEEGVCFAIILANCSWQSVSNGILTLATLVLSLKKPKRKGAAQ